MTRAILATALVTVAVAATPAIAQTAPRPLPTAGSMGGGVTGSMSGQPTSYSLRDGAGNLVIVNGVLRPAGSTAMTGGLADSPLPMAGGQTATALGNQLTVLATGSWNTIIVDAVQTNSGDITATAGAAGRKDH